MGGGPVERVLFTDFPPPEESLKELRKKYPNVEFTTWEVGKEVPAEIFAQTTILVTFMSLPKTASDAPNLHLIHFLSAGINHVAKHPIYTDSKIPLTTSNGIHGPQIAEWIILTALVHTHKYNDMYEWQKRKEWQDKRGKDQIRVRDLVGQRVGILGYGSIGRQVGRVAKAMGMDVLAYTATPKTTPESRQDHGYIVPGTGDPDGSVPSEWYSGLDKESLHNFLKQNLDLVVISLPLTQQTTHLLSTPEFSLLSSSSAVSDRPPPIISNISRGPIIDTAALIAALESGSVGGACLDVTDPEPLPSDHPLWSAPNVTITPHISGNSVKYAERSLHILELNLERKEKGEPLINLVDRRRGY